MENLGNLKSKKLGRAFALLRKSRGFNQSDFENISSRPTLNRFENGNAEFSSSKLFHCLEKMEATMADLDAAYHAPKDKPFTSLPAYKFSEMRYPRKQPFTYITYANGATKTSFALEVKDAAMINEVGAYPIGSFLIVEPARTAKDGELVIINKDGVISFRRMVNGKGVPDNALFFTIEKPRIIGRVVGATWTI